MTARWIRVSSIILIMLVLPMFGVWLNIREASAAPVVIGFDDLEPNTLVTNQYVVKGVVFNGPRVFVDAACTPFIECFVHSPYSYIEQNCGEYREVEFCTEPIKMTFTSAQGRVKVWVGYASYRSVDVPFILKAYDKNGDVVDSDGYFSFPPGDNSIFIRTPLEVQSGGGGPNIWSASVSVTPNQVMPYLAVDDVEFDTAYNPYTTSTLVSSTTTSTLVSSTVGGVVTTISTHMTSVTESVVTESDFSFSASSSPVSVAQGSSGTAVIIASSLNGFNSTVDLSWSWLEPAPTDVDVTLSPSILVRSDTQGNVIPLFIRTGSSASTGSFMLRVTGRSGLLTHNTDVSIIFLPFGVPIFSMGISPEEISLCANFVGSNLKGFDYDTATVNVHSLGGFSSPVTLNMPFFPFGPFVLSVNPNTVTPPAGGDASAQLRVTVTSNKALGQYFIAISGASGSLAQDAVVKVNVVNCRAAPTTATITSTSTVRTGTTSGITTTTSHGGGGDVIIIITVTGTSSQGGGGGCLIATATYGSELSPEVQLLRNFRDGSILKTRAGSSFMVAFNAWYYSFSPTVANYLVDHWVERTIMKGALYPLIGILALSSGTFHVARSYPEFAALLSGLVASSLIGAFYIGLPVGLLRTKIRRLRGRRAQSLLEKLFAAMLLCGFGVLLAGEVLASPIVLMISAATVVLTTLFLSGTVTSALVAKRFDQNIRGIRN